MGYQNELKNRFIDVDYREQSAIQSAIRDGSKCNNCTLEELAILKELLKNPSITQKVMIVGLQTNFCIDASVKSAFERGYRVIIPKGTNSTFDNDYMDGETTYKYYNEMMRPKRFADCISLEEAIEMMEK